MLSTPRAHHAQVLASKEMEWPPAFERQLKTAQEQFFEPFVRSLPATLKRHVKWHVCIEANHSYTENYGAAQIFQKCAPEGVSVSFVCKDQSIAGDKYGRWTTNDEKQIAVDITMHIIKTRRIQFATPFTGDKFLLLRELSNVRRVLTRTGAVTGNTERFRIIGTRPRTAVVLGSTEDDAAMAFLFGMLEASRHLVPLVHPAIKHQWQTSHEIARRQYQQRLVNL